MPISAEARLYFFASSASRTGRKGLDIGGNFDGLVVVDNIFGAGFERDFKNIVKLDAGDLFDHDRAFAVELPGDCRAVKLPAGARDDFAHIGHRAVAVVGHAHAPAPALCWANRPRR